MKYRFVIQETIQPTELKEEISSILTQERIDSIFSSSNAMLLCSTQFYVDNSVVHFSKGTENITVTESYLTWMSHGWYSFLDDKFIKELERKKYKGKKEELPEWLFGVCMIRKIYFFLSISIKFQYLRLNENTKHKKTVELTEV